MLSRLTFPRALKYLDIGPGLEEEARRNLTLRDAPAAPAHEVYTGVLYEHLGLGSLPARQRADRQRAVGLRPARRPDPRLPALDGRDAPADRLAARAVARPAAQGAARRGPDRRHALRRLRRGLEAEAGHRRRRPRVPWTARPISTWSRPRAATSPASCSSGDPVRDARRTSRPLVRAAGHTVELSGSGRSDGRSTSTT